MQSTDKLIYALLTAVTLSLAGCGGSSSKTAGTPADPPEPTELSKLQADAKTAATGAATAATGAATAVADVIPLQTTGMEDGYHKAESLVQKDIAVTKSGEARTAADNAAEATTVADATTHKNSAEAARTAAETARDEAVKAAMMDVKYAGDMYKVGDHSITPGSLKKVVDTTMADGKVKTQTVGSRDITLGNSPITATPKISERDLVVGTYTDSQDDTVRLRLMDKYSGTDKANMFHDYIITGETAVEKFNTDGTGWGPITEQAPHGTWNGVPIKREEGVFYEVTGLRALSLIGSNFRTYGGLIYPKLVAETGNTGSLDVTRLPADAKDQNAIAEYGIYSWTPTADYTLSGTEFQANTKYYIRKTVPQVETYVGSEDRFYKYNQYNIITVVKDVTFPVAKSYEHMNYGLWASLKEDGETPSELGKGFVRILDGKSMTADMPTKGTATYHGHWVANVRKAHDEGTGDIIEMEGGSKTAANFETNAITVDLLKKDSATDKFASLTGGTISGNRFKGTGVTVVETTTSGLKTTGKYTEGDSGFSGAFFGPEAVEVGGVFHFTSKDKKDGEFTGAFGGRKM